MYNADQCDNETENEKAQEGKKVGGGAEIEAGLAGDKVASRMVGTCFIIRADLGKAAGMLYVDYNN